MKLYVITIFSLLAMIICFSACSPKSCVDASYHFTMNENFLPEKDSIRVGDTLWMNSSHSTTFIDLSSNKSVDFSNSLLGSNIRILQFPEASTNVSGAVNNFIIVKIFGREIGNDNIPAENKGFYFEEINSNYTLKLGFVAKQKGIYVISVGNSLGVVQNNQGCSKADVEINNNNNNNHLYFYQNFFPGSTISDYTRTHVYCFKVY